MASSVLSGGSPRRLFLHAGKWVLEVVRQVNLGQDLIRPTTERLIGQRAITSYFKNNPDKAQLGKATLRLVASALEGETLSYTAEGVDWIANSMPPPRPEGLDSYPPPAEAKTVETLVSELEARVVVLTAMHEGMLTRLARLETKLARGAVPAEGKASAQHRPGARDGLHGPESVDGLGSAGDSDSPISSEAGSESFPGQGSERARAGAERGEAGSERKGAGSDRKGGGSERKGGASERSGGGSESASGGEALDAEGEAGPGEPQPDSSGEELAAEEEFVEDTSPTPPRILLTLPPVFELTKCVALLIGGEVTAKEGTPPLPVNRTTTDCYAAPILDDNDQTVGVILMDLKATVFLGGTLMMLPRTEIEQQQKALAPGEDSIAASAEICNALSGAINGFQGQHVRVGGLQKFEFKSWSWVTKPYDRRDLEDSFGGRTVVASRPPPVQIA